MGAGESMKFVFISRGTKMLVAATMRFSDGVLHVVGSCRRSATPNVHIKL